MSFLYLTGSGMNLLGRSSLSISPTAASVSAAANVCDGDPGCPLLFGSAGGGYIRADLNALTNGGFETSTLSGWTTVASGGGSSVSETTTSGQFRSGSKALKLIYGGGVGTSLASQTFTARSGEYRKASFWIKTPSSGTLAFYLKNATTDLYLKANGTWGTSSDMTYTATGSWVEVAITYRVETFESTGADTVSLVWSVGMITGTGGVSGTVCVDDCYDIPGVSFASIHGHNFRGGTFSELQSSSDGSTFATQASLVTRRPAMFTTLAMTYARYWQFTTPSMSVATYVGEAVLGQYETSATPCLSGPLTTYDLPGARSFSDIGRPSAYSYATDPRESVRLEFSADTEAAARELIYSLFVRSKQGQLPAIVVPLSTETSVYYGRIANPMEQRRPFLNIYDVGFDLVGDPFPTVGL